MVKFAPGTLGRISFSSTWNSNTVCSWEMVNMYLHCWAPFSSINSYWSAACFCSPKWVEWIYQLPKNRKQMNPADNSMFLVACDILKKHPQSGTPGFISYLDVTCDHNLLPVVFWVVLKTTAFFAHTPPPPKSQHCREVVGILSTSNCSFQHGIPLSENLSGIVE